MLALDNGKVKAILDGELKQLLVNLEIYDSFTNNQEQCFFCQETVSEGNLTAIFPKDNEVCFCCKKRECIENLARSSNLRGV